jgi:hypothetical protein
MLGAVPVHQVSGAAASDTRPPPAGRGRPPAGASQPSKAIRGQWALPRQKTGKIPAGWQSGAYMNSLPRHDASGPSSGYGGNA